MAVPKKPAKKSAAKAAPTKKAATKKGTKTPVATKKAPPAKKGKAAAVATPEKPRRGRPPGPVVLPEWIEVTQQQPFSRVNAVDPKPGVGSLRLRAGEAGAVALEKLAELIEAKDARLLKLLK